MDLEDRQDREFLVPSKHKTDNSPSHVLFLPEYTDMASKASRRPYQDSVFTFLFLATISTTYGWGMFAVSHADLNLDSKLRRSVFNPDTNQCEIAATGVHTEHVHTEQSAVLDLMVFLPMTALVAAFPTGFFLFWLLRRCTRGVVLMLSPLVALIPVVLCVGWVTWCYGLSESCTAVIPLGIQVFYLAWFPFLAALSVYRLWQSWSENTFEALVQILKMATDALVQNFWLLVLQPVLFVVSLGLLIVPIFGFLWYAIWNGTIVPNIEAVHDHACDIATGFPCCVERRSDWVTAYVYLACFTVFWVLMVTIHLQVMVVSGTISQWYFAPTGSPTNGNIRRALRIAFGPSFGTACNLGTIVTTLAVSLLGLLKKVVERVVNSCSRHSLISAILRGCFQWLFQFPECNSRFAPDFAILSGKGFWESTKKVNSLLRRNSLSTTGIEFAVPIQRGVNGMALVCALLQSLAIYGALEIVLPTGDAFNVLSAALCFLATLLGLMQIFTVIYSVIDAVYVCYAMEKDTGDISKPEICHPYMLLQKNQAVLEARLASEEKLTNAP